MASPSALTFLRVAKAPALPPPVHVSARPERASHWLSHVLPAQPSSIPSQSDEKSQAICHSAPLLLQRKLAIGSTSDPLEAEADAMAMRVMNHAHAADSAASTASPALRLQAANAAQRVEAPHSVHEVLRSSGKPLDAATRALMEPHFGRNLSNVRIHTGPRAEESARAVDALAYTVGQDAVFAAGCYDPHSAEGRRLLAHELSHTIQQAGGESARHAILSSSAPVLQTQHAPQDPTQDTTKDKPKTDQVTLTVPLDDLLHLKLTEPSLITSKQQHPLLPSPGTLTLGGASTGAAQNPYAPPFGFSPPLTQPGTSPLQQPTLPGVSPFIPSNPAGPSPFTPTPGQGSGTPATASPAAPSRLSIHDFGPLSLGLRLGFPALKTDDKADMSPSAAQEALQRAEIFGYVVSGKVPSAYTLDKGKLASAIWGIFSTSIAPDVARKIASSLSSKKTSSGISYELDAVLNTDLKGGGFSFTLRY